MQAKASAFTAGPPEFKVRSNIGNDFGQIGSKENEGERPPRSAKLVAYIDYGSGPGGGDYRTCLLSTDRTRSGWTLWMVGYDGDTAKRLYCIIAWGKPYRGVPAKTAAQMLVTKSREDERELEGASGGALVMTAGLLDDDDIQVIEQSVFNLDDEC